VTAEEFEEMPECISQHFDRVRELLDEGINSYA